MLYQAIVQAVLVSSLNPEPVELKPQLEADSPDDALERIKVWLDSCGYKHVDGTEVRLHEVALPEEPESEEAAAARALLPAPEPTLLERLSAMKNHDLRAFAAERGVNIDGLRSNADITNAILSAAESGEPTEASTSSDGSSSPQ